jgi:hypothetical protein
MAYMLIKIEAPKLSAADLNEKLNNGLDGSGKTPDGQMGVMKLENLLNAVSGGVVDAEVSVVVRETDQAISKQGAGKDAFYNLK